MEDDKKTIVKQVGAFITIPFALALPPILGYFIGNTLDSLLHTSPYLMYFFIALGFAGGVREVYHIIKRFGYGSD